MKTFFESPAGHEGMRVDCGTYYVEIFKNLPYFENGEELFMGNCIKYVGKETGNQAITPFSFLIDWDDEENGGKLYLHQKDKWGCEMSFTHYFPGDLKGMFDFIGRGYDIFNGKHPIY